VLQVKTFPAGRHAQQAALVSRNISTVPARRRDNDRRGAGGRFHHHLLVGWRGHRPDRRQGETATALAQKSFLATQVTLHQDYASLDRVVIVQQAIPPMPDTKC